MENNFTKSQETKEIEQPTIKEFSDSLSNFFEIISSATDEALNIFQTKHTDYLKQYGEAIKKQINSKRIIKEINDFLNLAKNDLNAYKTLIKEKNYHNAIYHLQQSIEKTIKALLFFIIVDFNPKKIGHDFSNIMPLFKKNKLLSGFMKEFIVILEEKLNIFNSKSKLKLFGNTKIDLSNFWNNIDDKIFLRDFKEKMICIFSHENNSGIIFFISMFLIFKNHIKNISNTKNEVSLNNIFYSSELYIFHMILSPHEESTRYPKSNKNKMGPEDYTEKTSIFDFSNNISIESEEIIEHINKMILNIK
jgi:HEPN domain-containing protein